MVTEYRSRVEENQERLRQNLLQLAGHVPFRDFVGIIRELHDQAVANAVGDPALQNERMVCAALGEIRAYRDILGIVDSIGPLDV